VSDVAAGFLLTELLMFSFLLYNQIFFGARQLSVGYLDEAISSVSIVEFRAMCASSIFSSQSTLCFAMVLIGDIIGRVVDKAFDRQWFLFAVMSYI
jgi:hypothetical protein